MSDADVIIKLLMDAEGVKRGASEADKALSGIEKKTGSGLGFGILAGVGAAAFNAISSAAGDTVAAVINVGSSFEKQMSKVEAISGASASEIAMMTEKARQMGATTSFSASEAGQAMEYMAMAGWKASDMVKGIGGIMDLAAASGEDLGTTSDIVTDALTAFGLKAKDSGRFADVLAAASSNANTNVSLMGETFKYVGAAAGAMGYSVEDMSVAIGLMANSGIKGSQAGTALRSTITRLAKPTKESQTAIDKLGLSLTDSEGNMRSFRDIMKDMRSGFADLSEAEKAETAAMLGGQEAMSGLLAIVNASDEDFDKLADSIDNAGGSAHRMAETSMDNLSGSLTRFQSAAEGLGIAIFDHISGPLSAIVDLAAAAIGGITGLLTEEKTQLGTFLEEVEGHARESADALQASFDAMDKGEAEVGKLTAYEKVLIRVAEAGQANEYQTYQMKAIIEELGDEMPELVAAWDEETRTLRMNSDEIEKNFEARKKAARMEALVEAQEQAMRALGEAEMTVAMTEAAIQGAIDDTNDKLGLELKTTDDLILRYQAYGDVSKAAFDIAYDGSKKLDEARQKAEECQEQVDYLAATEAHMAKAAGESADALAENAEAEKENAKVAEGATEATEEQNEAVGRLVAMQAKLTDAYKNAQEEVQKTFDTAKKAAESAFSVDPFSAWADSSKNNLQAMSEALAKQQKDMENYANNLQTVKEKLAGMEGGTAFLSYLEGLGPAAATAVEELAASGADVEGVVQKYVAATNMQESLTNMLALDAVAMEYGLGLVTSKAEEWEGLTSLVSTIAATGADVDSAVAAAFQKAAETARAVGVSIPDGLAESIASSETPEEAIGAATMSLQAAIEGHLQTLVDVGRGAGLKIPDSITDGIEEGGPAAVKAFGELMALFSGSEVTRKAEEGGKAAAEASVSSQASTMEGKKGDVEKASGDVAEAGAKSAESKKTDYGNAADASAGAYITAVKGKSGDSMAAGAEIGRAGADGAGSTVLLWNEAGAMAAAGFAKGILSGRSEVINAAAAVATDAITTAKKKLDERSPSHVFENIGYMGGKGWAIGFLDSESLVTSATSTLAKASIGGAEKATESIGKAYDRLRARLNSGAAYGSFSDTFKDASAISSNTVAKAVETAENAMERVSERYFTGLSDANAARLEKLEEQQGAMQERHTAALKAISERRSAALKAISERQSAAQDDATRKAVSAEKKALEERLDAEEKATKERQEAEGKALKKEIDGLKKRKQKIQQLSGEFASSVLAAYNAALETQADRIDRTLTDSLEKAATTAQKKIDALNSKVSFMRSGLLSIGVTYDGDMTGAGLIANVKEQIRDIRAYEEQLTALEARGISETLLSEVEGMDASQTSDFMATLLGMSDKDLTTYDKLFAKRAREARRVAKEHYAEEIKAVKSEYTDKVEEAFAKAEKSISQMGEKAMKGFLKGMKESGYSREIRKIAKNIVSEMADELEIRSPSRKAERLAVYYAKGFDKGIEGSETGTRRTMQGYAEAGITAFQRGAELSASRKAATFATAPSIRRLSTSSFAAASPELSSVPATSVGEQEYKVTLITTLDGREIARGTARYTQAELDRMEAIRARKEGRL